MPGVIERPFGKAVKRVVLEQDAGGAIKVTAVHVLLGGVEQVMSPLECLYLFLQFSADLVRAMCPARGVGLVSPEGDDNGKKSD